MSRGYFQKNYKSQLKFHFIFYWARDYFQKNYKSRLKFHFVFYSASGESIFLKDFYYFYKRRFFFLTKKVSHQHFFRSIWWEKGTKQDDILSILWGVNLKTKRNTKNKRRCLKSKISRCVGAHKSNKKVISVVMIWPKTIKWS